MPNVNYLKITTKLNLKLTDFIKYYLFANGKISAERNATYRQIVKEIEIKASFPPFNANNISEKSRKFSHKTLANNSNHIMSDDNLFCNQTASTF